MKFLQTSILMSLLASLVMGCTSTTALQSSETDDMYYSSADKTVRKEVGTPPPSEYASDEVMNPEYSASGSTGGSVTNNYNYYDSDYSYASRSRTVRSPYRNWSYYNYGYYHDPYWYTPGSFYSPMPMYSAVGCFPGMYDPFCGPAFYPYSGVTVSIGFGYGYGGYGMMGHRPWGYSPWGYNPYGYYGGGYGNGYYQGFYEGYYANNSNYYGVNRRIVNNGPRPDRSNVPVNAPAGSGVRPSLAGGNREGVSQPATGGRPANNSGNRTDVNTPSGRPQRAATTSQPGSVVPGRTETGRPVQNVVPEGQARPARDGQSVRPQNYEFQEQPARPNTNQNTPRNIVNQENNRPVQEQQTAPASVGRDRQPEMQQERPVYRPQPGLSRPSRSERQVEMQQTQPAQEAPRPASRGLFNRPARTEQPSAPVIRENRSNNNSYSQPSQSSSPAPSRNSGSGSQGGGRPRR